MHSYKVFKLVILTIAVYTILTLIVYAIILTEVPDDFFSKRARCAQVQEEVHICLNQYGKLCAPGNEVDKVYTPTIDSLEPFPPSADAESKQMAVDVAELHLREQDGHRGCPPQLWIILIFDGVE